MPTKRAPAGRRGKPDAAAAGKAKGKPKARREPAPAAGPSDPGREAHRPRHDGFHARPKGRGGLRRFTLVLRPPLPGAGVKPAAPSGFTVLGRRPNLAPESVYEKQLVLAAPENERPGDLLWADARYAVDALAEHALFFSLVMPPEVAAEQKRRAQGFHERYTRLWQYLDAKGPPAASELQEYVRSLQEETMPFLEYTDELHRGQVSGALQSLAWPLFFDHTRRETDRALARMEAIAAGETVPDLKEVVSFGSEIMEEHGRFLGHLLDPQETELVERCFKEAGHVRALRKAWQDDTPTELDQVEAAAERVLDFKTELARRVEGARVRSALSPILADHVRREAIKFLDELHRASKGQG